MRNDEFDRILDDCLDRIAAGATVAECVAAYPELESRLEPLLRAARHSRDAYDWQPSLGATQRARTRFRVAVASRAASRDACRRPSLLERLTARPLPLTAIATFAVIALTVLLVAVPLSPGASTLPPELPTQPGSATTSPPESTTTPTTTTTTEPATTPTEEPTKPTEPAPDNEPVTALPDADGNLVFYMSDAPNDIGDFSSLIVTIESINLKPDGDGQWISITPTETQSDLVQLQGELAHELWRGQVPQGDYTTVFLNVSHIEGILSTSGLTADVSLPSDTLHVTVDFSVSENGPVEFVFDITVHKTGEVGHQAHYVLQPQAGESGVGRRIRPIVPEMPAHDDSGKPTDNRNGSAPQGEEQPDTEAPKPGPGPEPGINHLWNDPEVLSPA